MRVAVIGSGIAGLGAAWALRDHADVTIFEKSARIGGHAHTVIVGDEASSPIGPVAVDTGFIVYNTATYPNLIALFDHLGISTKPSDMSFAVSLNRGRVEYAGDNFRSLIGHWQNLLRPYHARMILDLMRFLRHGAELGRAPPTQTLGEFLKEKRYSKAFRDNHLLPMASAIWSATPQKILDFPARSFGSFFRNHGLLEADIKQRPPWRTVEEGSKTYIDRLVQESRATLMTGASITQIQGETEGAALIFADGTRTLFDQLIVATHADEALALLPTAAASVRDVLGAFHYAANETYLHQDIKLMPRRKRLWASWNYMRQRGTDGDKIYISYWMNRLQGLDPRYPFFVTLNPPTPPVIERTILHTIYHHPQFDRAAMEAQAQLRYVQGHDRIWLCGSYCGYGFHEDALASGLAVAAALGAPRPWRVPDVSPAFVNATPRTLP